MKYLYSLFALFLIPLYASASLPDFPMSLYGGATINGTPAPVGTIVRAYYGTILAGQVSVLEVGVYGYNHPMKQQLIIGAGSSTLRFTITTPLVNGGSETEGSAPQTALSFLSGVSVDKDLVFIWVAPPAPPSPPAPSSGGGGGGGGGGGTSVLYGCMDKSAVNYSSIANKDNGACLYSSVVSSKATTTSTSSKNLPQSSAGQVLGVSTFRFERNLGLGATGVDVLELQKRLTTEGYYRGSITGYLGALTTQAIKAFQLKHGLEQVGTIGPKTREMLNRSTGSVMGASTITPPASTMSVADRAVLIEKLLAMIMELQRQLALLKR